jgi:hypothetical protein
VVNHVGFVVQNVQETALADLTLHPSKTRLVDERKDGSVAKWKAAGVPVLPGNCNRLDQTCVETADGLRIEILENKSQNYPIQHEHVHFFLPEVAIPLSQAWYGKVFGAKASRRDNAPVADVPGA